jgi:hypothetical protein
MTSQANTARQDTHTGAMGNPTLSAYLDNCQNDATILHGMIEGACHLDNEDCSNALTAVLGNIEKLSGKLTIDLDSVNLPEPDSASPTQSSTATTSKTPEYIKDAINRAYDLSALAGVLSQAVDGSEISGKSFDQCGGGRVVELVAKLAGDLIDCMEAGDDNYGLGLPK